jgi:hypothetical protein
VSARRTALALPSLFFRNPRNFLAAHKETSALPKTEGV